MCDNPEKMITKMGEDTVIITNAPNHALISATIPISTFILIKMLNGAIFCQDKAVYMPDLDNCTTTYGTQNCTGTAPIFKSNPATITGTKHLLKCIYKPPLNIIRDPILCTKKYIMALFFLCSLLIRGTKHIKFNSKPNQAIGHDKDDKTTNVPIITPKTILYNQRVTG
jgi:hypothetical protein